MKVPAFALVALFVCAFCRIASALNDDYLKDDQAWLQQQIAAHEAELAKGRDLKASSDLAKLHIAAGNASASDYAAVAQWRMMKDHYDHTERELRQARHGLRKVDNRINELGTRRPPQKHDPYSGGGDGESHHQGGCGPSGSQGGCGPSGQSSGAYYMKSSPDSTQSSTKKSRANTQSSMHNKHSSQQKTARNSSASYRRSTQGSTRKARSSHQQQSGAHKKKKHGG